ncbi:MAG: hypothetical protein OQK01_13395, partial [Xanthomonadales bacterium]|nr:hypothetical protein [Xanthomonadales bacterium]
MQTGEEQIQVEHEGPLPVAEVSDPVCAFLLEHQRVKSADLKRAQTYQEQNGGDLVSLLVRLG